MRSGQYRVLWMGSVAMGGVYQGLGGAKPPMIILLGARGAKPPMHGHVTIFEYPGFCV